MIALCLLAVSGCSDAPARRDAGALPAPFDGAGSATAQQSSALHRAEERAIASCMRDRGFSYLPVPAARPTTDNPYGLLTGAQAAADGYGLTSAALAGPAEDPNEQALAPLSEDRRAAWRNALIGTGGQQRTLNAPGSPSLHINTDGCVHLGRQGLYGSAYDQAELTVEGLTAQVVTQVSADEAFVAAQGSWARCMRGRSESARTLQEARASIQDALGAIGDDRARLRELGRRELRLAGHDAACQRESGMAAAVRTVQERIEASLPEESRQQGAALAELRKRALEE
ncbi:hypothetical protein ACWDZZ_25825 [Streptomyces sp. NPDC002990]